MARLGFGTCGDECPWRGGANENTVFSVSHDVEIERQRLPAGRYGLHFIPGPDAWTVIFSKNSTSWGSFFYDAGEDALRVTVKPAASPHAEWLTYEFVDRQPDRATVALRWERLQVPWTIRVPDVTGLWVDAIRRDMRAAPGFSWVHRPPDPVDVVTTAARHGEGNTQQALEHARKALEQAPDELNRENLRSIITRLEAGLPIG